MGTRPSLTCFFYQLTTVAEIHPPLNSFLGVKEQNPEKTSLDVFVKGVQREGNMSEDISAHLLGSSPHLAESRGC